MNGREMDPQTYRLASRVLTFGPLIVMLFVQISAQNLKATLVSGGISFILIAGLLIIFFLSDDRSKDTQYPYQSGID